MQKCKGELPENSIPCELLGGFSCRGTIQLLHDLWRSEEPPEAFGFFLEAWRICWVWFILHGLIKPLLQKYITHLSINMCDYLPLCDFIILQPLAADQEIIKSQTHGAAQWGRAQCASAWGRLMYQCWDRMLTRQDAVVISPHTHSVYFTEASDLFWKARGTNCFHWSVGRALHTTHFSNTTSPHLLWTWVRVQTLDLLLWPLHWRPHGAVTHARADISCGAEPPLTTFPSWPDVNAVYARSRTRRLGRKFPPQESGWSGDVISRSR